ncbi:hypothetical protein PMAYCL1PPCAC_00930, partial [Pristionchus mayeri]
MMLSGISLVLLLSLSTLDARVTFEHSQVLDNVDLRGTNTAELGCVSGCRVYSPTDNEKILIVGNSCNYTYNERDHTMPLTLLNLAGMQLGESFGLPPCAGGYTLENTGAPNPSFVLYVVEKDAEHNFTPVFYVD